MADFTIGGLNHLGLVVEDIEMAKQWFAGTLGFEILEDRGELVFFLIGHDLLAVKTPRMAVIKPEHGAEANRTGQSRSGWQSLDHYGFFAGSPDEVDAFAKMLEERNLRIVKGPYSRSDGRSVYFVDPCGLVGEYLYYKPSYRTT
jgi:catechol 2,3-dioxygenase-like lactoylglutathione lyase family enzyme